MASRVAPRLSSCDAARDAVDAARGRMIDRRGSVVTAEPDEECLLQRGMTTSRKCVSQPVPFRRPSRLAAAACKLVLTFDTVNLEARYAVAGGRR